MACDLDAKVIHPNVDFYSGVLYKTMGIDPDFFTTILAEDKRKHHQQHKKQEQRQKA